MVAGVGPGALRHDGRVEGTSLRFKPSIITRLVAWLLVAVGVATVAGSVAAGGNVGLAAVVAAPFAMVGILGLRLGVRALPDRLAIVTGLRTRSFSWGEVDGFAVEVGQGWRRVVAVVDGRTVELPITDGGVLGIGPAVDEVRAALDAYRDGRRR